MTLACTLSRALSLAPVRKYVILRPGTYTSSSAFLVTGGERWLIGASPMPTITRTTQGPVFTIDAGTDVTFENLQIAGASGTTAPYGFGIECPSNPAGTRVLRMRDVVVAQNAADGVSSRSCNVYALRSTFRNNGWKGLNLADSNGTIDRCTVSGNQTGAITLDAGVFTITNSFIYRNVGGIDFFSQTAGNRFEFNTIVDNPGSTPGIACNGSNVASSHPNNIVARNTPNTYGNTCTYPSSFVVDSDVGPLKFKSPDVAPYDYHITAGSIAIDNATASTVDHDFDGQVRTAPRDVGADEFVP